MELQIVRIYLCATTIDHWPFYLLCKLQLFYFFFTLKLSSIIPSLLCVRVGLTRQLIAIKNHITCKKMGVADVDGKRYQKQPRLQRGLDPGSSKWKGGGSSKTLRLQGGLEYAPTLGWVEGRVHVHSSLSVHYRKFVVEIVCAYRQPSEMQRCVVRAALQLNSRWSRSIVGKPSSSRCFYSSITQCNSGVLTDDRWALVDLN